MLPYDFHPFHPSPALFSNPIGVALGESDEIKGFLDRIYYAHIQSGADPDNLHQVQYICKK